MEQTGKLVVIGAEQVEWLVYKGQPVVTFAQVAQVHGCALRNVQRKFSEHQDRFIEGKHFYRLDFEGVSQSELSVHSNHNGLTVFTEAGYLLLVKPMRDDVSWQVQELMIEAYFRDKIAPLIPQPVKGDLTDIWVFIREQQESNRQMMQAMGEQFLAGLQAVMAPLTDRIEHQGQDIQQRITETEARAIAAEEAQKAMQGARVREGITPGKLTLYTYLDQIKMPKPFRPDGWQEYQWYYDRASLLESPELAKQPFRQFPFRFYSRATHAAIFKGFLMEWRRYVPGVEEALQMNAAPPKVDDLRQHRGEEGQGV